MNKVLDFWFSESNRSRWFAGGVEFDAEIKKLFLPLYEQAKNGKHEEWKDSVEGRLALILMFDQFSRNMFRGTEEAFAMDEQALQIAKLALRRGDDLWFRESRSEEWSIFLYMPFMHSEDVEDQQRCVELFTTYGPQRNIAFARSHYEVVARFGRFPHRNKALGRETTEDEEIYLTAGDSWGQ